MRKNRAMPPHRIVLLALDAVVPFDLGVPLWLSAPARELVVENGEVRGAIIEKEGKPTHVRAKRAVVLACGGFPHDVARRKELFPHAPTGAEHYSPGPTGNTLRSRFRIDRVTSWR